MLFLSTTDVIQTTKQATIMTQRQQQIIEEYLFDVFVKLGGNGEKTTNWWNNVFLLEAITNMGQRDYRIATFCEPCEFFKDEEADECEHDEGEDGGNETEDDDSDMTDADSTDNEKRHEAVDKYLANYYQHEDYYHYPMRMTSAMASRSERIMQQQYLYIYTIENSEYFMNKFICGDEVVLK